MNLHKVILLIGDDPEWMDRVGGMFEQLEHIILIAANGFEGFQIAQCDPPDLIISKSKLSDMSGIKLYRLFRTNKELFTIPFILVNDNQKNIDKAIRKLEKDMDDYLTARCNPAHPLKKSTRLFRPPTHSKTYLHLFHQIICLQQPQINEIIKHTSELIQALNIEQWIDRFEKNQEINDKFDGKIELGMNLIDDLVCLLKEQLNILKDLADVSDSEDFNGYPKAIKRQSESIYNENIYNLKHIFLKTNSQGQAKL